MMIEIAGGILDLVFVLWLWIPGIVLSLAIGLRNPADALPLGFIFSASVVLLVYSLGLIVGFTEWVLVARVVLSVLGLFGLYCLRHEVRSIIAPAGLATTIATAVVAVRNVGRLDGWMLGADQFLTAWVASLMQAGDVSGIFEWTDVQKKGLALPVLLGVGREGLLLLAITTLIFVLALLATYRLVSFVLNDVNPRTLTVVMVGALAVWASSAMFWGFAFYQHGHALVALCVAVLVRLVLGVVHRSEPETVTAIALFTTTFVLAQTRTEIFILGYLLLLPYLWRRPNEMGFRALSLRLLAALGGPVGVTLWWGAADSSPLDALPAGVTLSVILLVAIGATLFVFYLPGVRSVVAIAIPAVLAGGTVPFLLQRRRSGANNLEPLVANTFLGEGMWGYVWWLVLIGFTVVFATRNKTAEERNLLWLTVIAILFTIVIKATDGMGGGRLGIIRLGWGDSVNRTLFHSFPLVFAITTLGLSYWLRLSRPPDRFGESLRKNTLGMSLLKHQGGEQ